MKYELVKAIKRRINYADVHEKASLLQANRKISLEHRMLLLTFIRTGLVKYFGRVAK